MTQLRKSSAVKRAYKIKDLYFNQNMSMREIAELLGISSATVWSYIHATKVRGVDVTDWEVKKNEQA